MQTGSTVRKQYKRVVVEMTYECRRFIILVDPITDANPERNEYTSEANKAESNATCIDSYPPQSCNEHVDSKYLARCAQVAHFKLR
jgi:hypothetical protein